MVKLISSLLKLWKTRLSKGEKMTSRWITYRADFCKETVIHQLIFESRRYQYVNYYSRAEGTEWMHLKAEMSVKDIADLLIV